MPVCLRELGVLCVGFKCEFVSADVFCQKIAVKHRIYSSSAFRYGFMPSSTGKVIVNAAPVCIFTALMLPWCALTISLAIDKPIP